MRTVSRPPIGACGGVILCMRLLLAACFVVAVGGCGGSSGSSSYPTVVVEPPKYGPAVTTANGAIVREPLPPGNYAAVPSPSCEWVSYKSSPQGAPGKAFLSPPAPGLRAKAISARTIRIDYSFTSLPGDCKPSYITLGILASGSSLATPRVEHFPIHGMSGEATLAYASFLPRPDVALASADMSNGLTSRTVKVLIRR